MNTIANIWNHPRTSAAGLLIAASTVAAVLSQQGINLGHAGSGTIVTLAGALATALLGLLAKDPGGATTGSGATASAGTARLGAWALISLLVAMPFLGGCSGVSVAQDIVNWTPALESAVATVDTTASLLAPADAPVFAAATAGFDVASNVLVTQAKAYLANPTAGALAQVQAQIVAFQQQVNGSLLTAANIVDPASQKHALAAIQAVATVASAMLALVASVSSKAAVAQMASRSAIKRASVEPLVDHAAAAQLIAAHYGEPAQVAEWQMARANQRLAQDGM